jgi:hypothetical protein
MLMKLSGRLHAMKLPVRNSQMETLYLLRWSRAATGCGNWKRNSDTNLERNFLVIDIWVYVKEILLHSHYIIIIL